MSVARSSRRRAGFKHLVMVLVFLTAAVTARPDLTITNAAGVRAGITGIVRHAADNSVGVDYVINDPTGTNVTTFAIQRSFDLVAWTNYTPTLVITGSISGEASDFAGTPKQFYRMRLTNF